MKIWGKEVWNPTSAEKKKEEEEGGEEEKMGREPFDLPSRPPLPFNLLPMSSETPGWEKGAPLSLFGSYQRSRGSARHEKEEERKGSPPPYLCHELIAARRGRRKKEKVS